VTGETKLRRYSPMNPASHTTATSTKCKNTKQHKHH